MQDLYVLPLLIGCVMDTTGLSEAIQWIISIIKLLQCIVCINVSGEPFHSTTNKYSLIEQPPNSQGVN